MSGPKLFNRSDVLQASAAKRTTFSSVDATAAEPVVIRNCVLCPSLQSGMSLLYASKIAFAINPEAFQGHVNVFVFLNVECGLCAFVSVTSILVLCVLFTETNKMFVRVDTTVAAKKSDVEALILQPLMLTMRRCTTAIDAQLIGSFLATIYIRLKDD